MVRLVDDLPMVNQVEQRCVAVDLPVSPDLVVPTVFLRQLPLLWVNPIASLPLCDSARFERTGVLLA